jgi:hypothetical protein
MHDTRHQEFTKSDNVASNLIPNFLLLSLLLCLTGLTLACGTSPVSNNISGATAPIGAAVSISPNVASITSQEQQQFTAKISGSPNTAVNWSASGGTISKSGVFTAPAVTSNTSLTITATTVDNVIVPAAVLPHGATTPSSISGPGLRATATVTVTPRDELAISTQALGAADAGVPYTAPLSVVGGVAPYGWSLANGVLPSGIALQTSSGIISGTTLTTGSYPFTAKVTDSSGHSTTLGLSLIVSANSNAGFDGPAELPVIHIPSAMSNTPAPGSTISVNAGGDLQSALNSASCGDTIQLQAGATFTGVFTFPSMSCDDNHWIIVRTSADDSTLPAEGTRLTPCYAGVSSLPGRPAFHCASTKNVLAKLVMAGGGSGPITFASGANHYRLIGLEITRAAGTGIVYSLWSVPTGTVNNLILDRLWLHGTAQDDTNRGVSLGASTYVSIVDSFFTDFHCTSISGACTDAQAIIGGLGDLAMGPYKIADNFLEASGENILFGGGEATVTPADIEITHNHMFKPLTWMKGQAGYVGGPTGNPFIVKNLLELKNAQRVLLDGNIMEDSWGGFSQVGFAILLTPKNQASSSGNTCPLCQVTDVTVRYTSISHVAAGLQIANALSGNGTGPALDGERYSIHDIVVDDIDGAKYLGPGEFAQISVDAGAPLLQNVTINHVTAFPPSTMFMVGDMVATSTKMKNFVFTNSIVSAGTYPIWSTGGGSTNCAYYDKPLTTFNACFSPYSFGSNAVIGSPSAFSPSLWPTGNFFPATSAAVQFVNYNGGNGGDYQLQSSSPYRGLGTDGKDLGADIGAINSDIAGVE